MEKEKSCKKLGEIMADPKAKVEDKYTSIFELKGMGNEESAKTLMENFKKLNGSELLMHEVTYALGQYPPALKQLVMPFLINVINDEAEFAVVRHEAAEGLSNFGDDADQILPIFQKYKDYKIEVLRDTCRLAYDKVKNYHELKQKYGTQYNGTKEPSAPFTEAEMSKMIPDDKLSIYEKVEKLVLSKDHPLFQKYRGMYLLRDKADEKSVQALCKFLDQKNWEATGVLLRHEVCFILGQLEKKAHNAIPQLKASIESKENEVVRHEALIAYGAIAQDKEYLKKFVNDPDRIVKESAIVALHTIDYWNN